MSRRNRFIATIFVVAPILILLLGGLHLDSLQKEYAEDRQQAADRHSDNTNARIEACRRASSIFAQIQCIGQAVSAEKEIGAAEKDLKAQQHMSLWAFGMAIISLATLTVTASGVVYVYFTLMETSAGVLVMRQEQRPWLHFDIPKARVVPTKANGGIIGSAFLPAINITNHGKAPAFGVAFEVKGIVCSHFDEAEVARFFEELRVNKPVTMKTVFPGQTVPYGKTAAGFNFGPRFDHGKPRQTVWLIAMLTYLSEGKMVYSAKVYMTNTDDLVEAGRKGRGFRATYMRTNDVYT